MATKTGTYLAKRVQELVAANVDVAWVDAECVRTHDALGGGHDYILIGGDAPTAWELSRPLTDAQVARFVYATRSGEVSQAAYKRMRDRLGLIERLW